MGEVSITGIRRRRNVAFRMILESEQMRKIGVEASYCAAKSFMRILALFILFFEEAVVGGLEFLKGIKESCFVELGKLQAQ